MKDQALQHVSDRISAHLSSTAKADAGIHCVTEDFDEFRVSLDSVFYSANIDPTREQDRVSCAQLSAVRLKYLTIGLVRFGNEVSVDPGDLGAYHVNVPVSGEVVSSCGERQMIATLGRAAVFTPHEHTVLPVWGADAAQICIKIDRAGVECELARILGHPVDKQIRFDLEMDLMSPAGARWLSMVTLLIETLDDSRPIRTKGLATHVEYLERSLISGLLVQQPHSMTSQIYAPVQARNPGAIQKVLDHIESRPGSQFAVSDLAVVAGISSRHLQHLFQEQFGMSPMTYVRQARLDGVRRELQRGVDDTQISAVAFSWGFNHLGRFAQHYVHKFGESPSHTLRAGLKRSQARR
ncbi:AraC family transcriptional regulator [Mycobacterium montefiorense]|uniref:Transcriptional regulator n=1 Tax=Mycobacterium montefiorense TaxID=154654 RepID=A0AA37PL25_9MYCO|nr:AraC family transcriptional regulator [Mycobacterium montefiorense]GBG39240.1 transcriptional regulator [Mycobacterium montefiorense]GKU37287.1 transcriptional regulator [Mycobacterium montefiorense]GKU41935.1 transcriptional regulator [Mycobacterium montefiorense]GKU45603.1 transcriptional regulator [Mycobacterium montefiorense]GKU53435.1 transcriptional regulator [Mycobacterium montefiorense]